MERLIQAVWKSFQWETLWTRTWGRHMRRWDNRCAEISNKESNSAEEIKGSLRIEELIIRLWCFRCMYRYHLWVHERQIVGLEALWAAGMFPSLISRHTLTKRHNVEQRGFSHSKHHLLCTCSLAWSLMLSGGHFFQLSAWWKSWQSHWQNATQWWNMSLCYLRLRG